MKPLREEITTQSMKKGRPWARTLKYYNPKLYGVYKTMINRCYRKNATSYEIYGGRGIKVCDEWLDSFDTFCTWALHNGYKQGLTLDRVDVNGNYQPQNCRFVDRKTQGRNRRGNRIATINGVSRTASEWAEIAGIDSDLIYYRLNHNWPEDKLLIKPLPNGRRVKK